MSATVSRYDAANFLGVSVDTLDRLRADGAIVALQVSKRLIRYRLADLEAYLNKCLTSPSSRSATAQTSTSNGLRVDVPVRDLSAALARLEKLESAMVAMRTHTSEVGQLRWMLDAAMGDA